MSKIMTDFVRSLLMKYRKDKDIYNKLVLLLKQC